MFLKGVSVNLNEIQANALNSDIPKLWNLGSLQSTEGTRSLPAKIFYAPNYNGWHVLKYRENFFDQKVMARRVLNMINE